MAIANRFFRVEPEDGPPYHPLDRVLLELAPYSGREPNENLWMDLSWDSDVLELRLHYARSEEHYETIHFIHEHALRRESRTLGPVTDALDEMLRKVRPHPLAPPRCFRHTECQEDRAMGMACFKETQAREAAAQARLRKWAPTDEELDAISGEHDTRGPKARRDRSPKVRAAR